MGILILGIWLLLVGINYLSSFMSNTLLGVGYLVVGALLILENRGVIR